jgi:N-acetylmuramoyl-L-alanine amidase
VSGVQLINPLNRFTLVLWGVCLFLAVASAAPAISVTKLSWDSKDKYTRFVMEFDQYAKCRIVDSIADKGFFYIDIYGMSMNYRRRLLSVNDNQLRYIDALTYPEHGVLRLVFYVKDPGAVYKIARVHDPVRLVVDTVMGAGETKEAPQDIAVSGAGQVHIAAQPAIPSTGTTISRTQIEIASLPGASIIPAIPEPMATPRPTIAPGKKKVVIIDPGHGGENRGAISRNKIDGRQIPEKELTLQFAIQLKKVIDASPNMVAILTRTDDSNVALQERVDFAERQTGDLFISLHLNEPGSGNPNARGVEMYYLSAQGTVRGAMKEIEAKENRDVGLPASRSTGDTPLVKKLMTEWEKSKLESMQYESYVACTKFNESFQALPFFRNNNRGIKDADFVVLKNFRMPAVLLEIGFISSSEDLKSLINPQFQQATGMLIYNGLNKYFAENDPGFRPHPIDLALLHASR